MGTHFENHGDAPVIVRLTKSPWRELGDTPMPRGHKFSLFQDEEATILGWLPDQEITATHTRTYAEVNLPQKLALGGLDGSLRSLRGSLATKRRSLLGVTVHFSPVSHDTWHYAKET